MNLFKKAISAKTEDDDVNMGYIGFIIVVVAATVIGILAVILNRDLTGAGMLCGAFLTSAFGGYWGIKREYSKREIAMNRPQIDPYRNDIEDDHARED